ncbi:MULTISPECIES: tripartite tricarboxylate transporter substrate binding protein [unclassified Variovorax]|uniref:Bug family tripartite tricarboxylate transporter substrate binding protein n=1 Tax=unclassified Variovorax TaxID=663243 RepID=UPI001BD3051A|nr:MULTISPECIES: tripartite tricarboxylate transporter substrate binding protein [unclassified Variovorax]
MKSSKPSLALHAVVAAALFLSLGASARAADEFPAKPIRFIVPYQAGGSTDIFARVVAEALAKRLGQPVMVENRTGAGGIIGTDYVAKSAPDGYTLLLTIPGPITANLALYDKLPYDPRTDLRMVSDVALARTVLAVNPSVPAKDVASLIEAMKASPGKYAMGSWGPGTLPHQVQVYMDKTYGVQTLHVPYKGEGPMAFDLISGAITMTVGSVTTLRPYVASGKLRALAVVGTRRADAIPQVPTFAEQGYPDPVYALAGPTSLLAPAKTPDAVVERLGREVQAVIKQPDVARRIGELGAEPVGNSPAQATAAYKANLPIVLKMVQDTGVKLD